MHSWEHFSFFWSTALRRLKSTGGTLLQFCFFLCFRILVFHWSPSVSPAMTGGGCCCCFLLLQCQSIRCLHNYTRSIPQSLLPPPAPEQVIIIWRTQDSWDPALSLTFQITEYSWKYCKYVVLERTKHSHWNIAVPHHNHLLEEAEKWHTSDYQGWPLCQCLPLHTGWHCRTRKRILPSFRYFHWHCFAVMHFL